MNDIYKILASFNKVAQEPAKAETKPVAKTQLQESMEQVLAKKLDETKTLSEKKQAKNPYAIGMAQAMKSTGDKPPLKKSTIKKAHNIAKKIDEQGVAEGMFGFGMPKFKAVAHDHPDGRGLLSVEGPENKRNVDKVIKKLKQVNPKLAAQGDIALAHGGWDGGTMYQGIRFPTLELAQQAENALSTKGVAEGSEDYDVTQDYMSKIYADYVLEKNPNLTKKNVQKILMIAKERAKEISPGFYEEIFRPKAILKAYFYLQKNKQSMAEDGLMKHTFAILDDTLIDQIANMNGAEVDPDASSVETYDENTARQLIAFAKKYPNRLKRTQTINTAGMRQMAQHVGGTASGPDYNLKEQGIEEGKRPELEATPKSSRPKEIARAQMKKMYGDGKITFSKTPNNGYFIQHEYDYGDTNSHQYDPMTGKVDFRHSISSTYYGEGIEEGKRPDYPDVDNDNNTKEPISKAAKDAKKKKMAEETRVHKGSYGTAYQGDDDEDDGKKAEPAKKKGRGRPKKGSDITGHVAKYSPDALSKAMGGGEKPKAKAKPSAVHKMKESTSKIDRMVNEAMDPEIEKSGLSYEQHQLKKHLGDDTYDELMAQLEQGQGPSEAIMDQLMSYYMDLGGDRELAGRVKMPYGTAKARDGDPYEWINNKLDELFPYVGDRRPEDYAAEGDMEEGNAFSGAVAKAKADGIQPGETITVSGKEYPVKEDQDLSEMKRLAGLAECGMSPVPMQQAQQPSSMNISTNMSSNGEKTVTVTATGDSASDLMQMLELAGMNSQQPAEPKVAVVTTDAEEAMEEEKDPRYEASTTPDETVLPTQSLTKGGDGDVAGEEKDMDPDGSARFSDNPMAVKKVKEEIDSLENMGLNLLKDYDSIKKVSKK